MGKSFRIVVRCDAYHSARHLSLNDNSVLEREGNTPTKWIFMKGISTLRQAQRVLLRMASGDAEIEYPNWGMAVMHPNEDKEVECYPTRKDGTRAYRKDTLTYEIEPEQ